ncbi:helix-turn-helix domain-containing protein [Novosphingobium sp. G106]|uniref:helix-turn-helix domain-containing protein n=1 Tax=Novosphingobium sp. G106 TaxID=2849500 RepID=UPI001C2DC9C3|nr:helix-turn-helix transcriptional regulator [Novosphingobium sp. G106]MBV1686345.1 helix-turn-helix domain-containing protein [Novosphingobium sp. G106]
MVYTIPADVLKHVREASGLSQTALAKAMGTVASVLSKLEKADEADAEMADRYLSAIGSELAHDVRDYYARSWLQQEPPTFLHPDKDALWTIDQALRDLQEFEVDNDDPILRSPIGLLRAKLRMAEAYLRRRDHVVAWVGDIGVGKTTALTHAVGLLVGDGRSGRRPAFPVGSGRTTVCETAIRVAPTFGIMVDTIEDEEVLRLTRDLVSSLAPGAAGVGVPAEVSRVLRTMSAMRTTETVVDDETVSNDPIAELLASGIGIDEVTDRVVSKMDLPARKERQILLPEGSEDGLLWLSRLVSAINGGLDPRFSVPARITVLMPSRHLSADGQVLQVVDTKGVESVTQRPDLADLAEDPRTLMVLCTKFADAPNATVQRLLQESVEAGYDVATNMRQCILVLPRGDEALEMSGFETPPSSRQQGYAVRRKEVDQALVSANLPKTPIYFFDARNDDPDKIWKTLRGQISAMRGHYVERANTAAAGVQNLRENIQDVRAAEARRDVGTQLGRILDMVASLPIGIRPAHQNLIDQMAVGHHSSIAASIARKGDWNQFQFDHILGQGVRIDANLRTAPMALRIAHKLDELQDQYQDLPTIVQTLQAIRERMDEHRQQFLATARAIGSDAFGLLLSGESESWAKSNGRYGLGAGYKHDVAAIWREWFEISPAAHSTAQAVHQRLQDAWTYSVIDPLRQSLQVDDGES